MGGACCSQKAVQVAPLHTVLPEEDKGNASAALGSSAAPAGPEAEDHAISTLQPLQAPAPPDPASDRPGARRKKKGMVKAAKDNDVACIDELIAEGADIEQLGMWDNTPLIVACSYGNRDAALRLIEHKAKIVVRNEQGATPLHYAAVEGLSGVVDSLLASSTAEEAAALANCGAAKIYNRHLDAYATRTPLGAAAESGFPAILGSLLAVGAEVDDAAEDGRTALWLACRRSKVSAARELLRRGADPSAKDAEGASVLEAAAEEGCEDLVLALLERGVDVNATSGSPLLGAVRKGSHRCSEALLTHGAVVSVAAGKESPLHLACRQGDEYLAGLLMKHKADPSAKDATEQTPLDLLRQRGLGPRQIAELLAPERPSSGSAGATGEA